MRIITLEEHVAFPELIGLIPEEILLRDSIEHMPMIRRVASSLAEVDNERLQFMDQEGISMQILSVSGAGADLLSPEEGPAFSRQYNDMLAAKISSYPDRFKAFAHLPMTNPAAAADELERTARAYGFKGALINGMTQGLFLDHPDFAPLLQRAEELDLPIYLHPGLPPKSVMEAYYSGLPGYAGTALAISGWGWHSETALHVLRLILSGTLDRYPRLKLIIGHMGEMLPMMMARCDDKLQINHAGVNQRPISRTLKEQVYITTSGIFTVPPLMVAIATFGIDRVLFSIDYPFSTSQDGRRFLDELPLSSEELHKIAHANAEKLFGL
jgi:predicted TIM-barrel fold metal-dependent hydrolase